MEQRCYCDSYPVFKVTKLLLFGTDMPFFILEKLYSKISKRLNSKDVLKIDT